MAIASIILVVVGGWVMVKLGPSGEAHFSVLASVPGAIVVPPEVLNAVDVPVRVTAVRPDGGAVFVAVAPSVDARAVLATSAVATVSGVHYPAGTLDLRASGSGELKDISTADVWRLAARGAGSAGLVVDQSSAGTAPTSRSQDVGLGAGPESAVVTSGDGSALTDVTVTLTWADHTWFLEALAATMLGGILAAFSLGDLWRDRAISVRRDGAKTASAEVAI